MYYYNKELIKNNETTMLEDFKNPLHILTRDEQFVLKKLNFIEKNFDSFATAKESTSNFDNFTIIVNNKQDNTTYEKEFKSFSELNDYMLKKEDTFLDRLVKNYDLSKKYEHLDDAKIIKSEITKLGGDVEPSNKKLKRQR